MCRNTQLLRFSYILSFFEVQKFPGEDFPQTIRRYFIFYNEGTVLPGWQIMDDTLVTSNGESRQGPRSAVPSFFVSHSEHGLL